VGAVQRCAALLFVLCFFSCAKKVLPLLLFIVKMFIYLPYQSKTKQMKYFESLSKSTQRAIAYAVLFASLTAVVLAMDFAMWLINNSFA
jgi:hypothetical protein